MTRSDRDMIVDKIQIQIQIQKVALDLMRNAIEAMASCPRREAANVDRFTVAHKGPGISADIADRLFQPFVAIKRHGMCVGGAINLPDDRRATWRIYRRGSESGSQPDTSVHRAICGA
ncbi:hypothetical protein [Bradyrhizobium sp. ERR14]|uniref:hypothetical protein n=1 Tax=Bradyrhizobium sp. ERR14 TaxID=2663837 RepID=UPI00184528DB|nr:hypothetical protein [Bradyrhizobium sp. ERR14]MBB4396649.1 nitrogen-specific signal transduction histidine kinase [Bradyrhizobium sp. ERR14]